MNIPKDKLPLKRTNLLMYGQYGIMCKHPYPKYTDEPKFAGQIAYKDLSKYVVIATNNFQEAIELLNKCIVKEDYTMYSKIKKFLDNIEKEINND